MNFGLIVAAGRGRRFGGSKQFATLRGQPVLYYSLRAFQDCPAIDEVVVVTTPTGKKEVAELCRRHRLNKVRHVLRGGRVRSASVRAGLSVLPAAGWVAVHDGARPCVTPQLIARVLKAAHSTGAAICGLPVTDTVKRVAGAVIEKTLDRANLWLAQTPQCFRLALLKRAHEGAGCASASDDARLVEMLGVKVRVVAGSPDNVKLTARHDLVRAERLLAR